MAAAPEPATDAAAPPTTAPSAKPWGSGAGIREVDSWCSALAAAVSAEASAAAAPKGIPAGAVASTSYMRAVAGKVGTMGCSGFAWLIWTLPWELRLL